MLTVGTVGRDCGWRGGFVFLFFLFNSFFDRKGFSTFGKREE